MDTGYLDGTTAEIRLRSLESRLARLEDELERWRRTEEERRLWRFYVTCSSATAVLMAVVVYLAALE